MPEGGYSKCKRAGILSARGGYSKCQRAGILSARGRVF